MKRRGIAILIVMLPIATVSGQVKAWAAPTLRITDSIRLDKGQRKLEGQQAMALCPDGSIALLGYNGQLVYLDSTGKVRWTRDLSRDIRWADRLSWRGDSLFVIDNLADFTVAVGTNGGVGGYTEFPDYVRPPWKDRRTMPAYGAFDVYAVADSSMIGVPRRPHTLGFYGGGTKQDGVNVPILRVHREGIVQSHMATVRNDPKGDVWSILQDGRAVVFHGPRDSVSFVGISPRGDTTFVRRMPRVPAIMGSVGGPDGTIWVSTGAGLKDFTHTAFDANGNVIGNLILPNSMRIGAGDARHVWVYETRRGPQYVRRYTLAPASRH